MVALLVLGSVAALAWLIVLVHPARPWDMQPVAERMPAPTPAAWSDVVAVVPARNEAQSLPHTLGALLGQDHPGGLRVVLVDDRSSDGTEEAARAVAGSCAGAYGSPRRLDVVEVRELADGWAGKLHAVQRGLEAAGVLGDRSDARVPRWVLLTDADILLAPHGLRRLVAQAEDGDWALVSRMARLSTATAGERLLVPAFTWFFGLLYPFRRVPDPASRTAAAAGGCMLVRGEVLRRLGGVSAIRDRIIDDVALARLVKDAGGRVQLAHARSDVTSMRRHGLGGTWRMVRRSAFVQLGHSWLLLGATLASMAMLFAAPPLLVLSGLAGIPAADALTRLQLVTLGVLGASLMTAAHVPAVVAHDLPAWRASLVPLAGMMFAAMTLDAAIRHVLRRPEPWRAAPDPPGTGRPPPPPPPPRGNPSDVPTA